MPTRATQYRNAGKTQAPTTRLNTTERGYGWRWQKFRKAYLADHPLCMRCGEEGRVTAAEHVHHEDGKGPLGDRGFDATNLTSLCQSCHNRITAKGRPHE